MSLHKQLWLTITGLLALVFVSTVMVNGLSARAFLEQQLSIKNADNAAILAQALSQRGAAQLQQALGQTAQFDSASYELVQFTDPAGKITVLVSGPQHANQVPRWFINLFKVTPDTGTATIQEGGQHLGTLTLRSDSRFAYGELWRSAQKTAGVFLVALLLAAALGSYLLKLNLRPLDVMAEQAQAIGEKRFVTSPEPAATEFRKASASLNNLALTVKSMLQQEELRPRKVHKEAQVDKITGLLQRDQFMKVLAAASDRAEGGTGGVASIVHLAGLSHLNQVYGRTSIDGLLAEIGRGLTRLSMQNSGWVVSRLNGSDFAIFAPHAQQPMDVAREAQAAIQEVLANRSLDEQLALPGASTLMTPGEPSGDMLTRLDGALLSAIAEGESNINVAIKGDIQVTPVRDQLNQWRGLLRQAFIENRFFLSAYPVMGLQGEILHYESPVVLQAQDGTLSASHFLPWINRLELASDLDKQVVDLALRQITSGDKSTCINLSMAAVADAGFLSWLSEKLSTHEAAAGKLWMEVGEPMAYRHLENFKKLCARAKNHGVKMGIEHMGHRLSDIGLLHDVGLDFMKIDAAFIRGIDQNKANQSLVGTLCKVGHSIDVMMIAEGVSNDAEWTTLQALGVDGVTGPGVGIS